MTQMNISMKLKQTHRYREQTCGSKGEGKEGKDWEFKVSRGKLLYTGWINKVLLYSTGKPTQCSVIAYLGKESGKEWI